VFGAVGRCARNDADLPQALDLALDRGWEGGQQSLELGVGWGERLDRGLRSTFWTNL
jgi:hypothetical protein